MNKQALLETAQAMVANDKGLLGMDESDSTCNRRLDSGEQPASLATEHLHTMNARIGTAVPWTLSHSIARALQHPALAAWRGKVENVDATQQALKRRAQLICAIMRGQYWVDLESN